MYSLTASALWIVCALWQYAPSNPSTGEEEPGPEGHENMGKMLEIYVNDLVTQTGEQAETVEHLDQL